MKQIKDLGISTKEGLTVKNLQRFPSMEWGEEGGLQAELWLGNHSYLGTLFQAGNGGPADFTWNGNLKKENKDKIKSYVHAFLLRNDKDYGPNSKYDFMKNKTPETIDDDDIEVLISIIEDEYIKRDKAEKLFKKGYNTVVAVNKGYEYTFLGGKILTKATITKYLKDNKIKYEDFTIYSSPQDLVLAL